MTIRFSVEHALVTDPLVGRASGYRLVARSRGVTSEDAERLAKYPLITDHLHLEESPGHHFAFHRLTSGRSAFTHRFAQGRRRGSFNRLAVHSLILDDESLARLEHDPWLLLSRARYQLSDGESPRPLVEVGAELAETFHGKEVTGRQIAPLTVRIDLEASEIRAERARLLRSRLDSLRRGATDESLLQDLARALTALSRGDRLLWPQSPAAIQRMLLTWSILPEADRAHYGYTTHLQPNAASLFALANVPKPEEQLPRLPAAETSGWRLHDDLPEASESALDWCGLLLDAPDAFDDRLVEADRRRWTLGHDLGRLGWSAYVARGGGAQTLLSGFQERPQLWRLLQRAKVFLDDSRALRDPTEIERPSYLLGIVAATLVPLCARETTLEMVPAVIESVAAPIRELLPGLLREDAVVELGQRHLQEVRSDGVVAAIALVGGEDTVSADGFNRLVTLWRHHGARIETGGGAMLVRFLAVELSIWANRKRAKSTGEFMAVFAEDADGSSQLGTRIESMPPSAERRSLAVQAVASMPRSPLARRLIRNILAPALHRDARDPVLVDHLGTITESAADLPEIFLSLLWSQQRELALAARAAVDRLDAERLGALAATWSKEATDREPTIGHKAVLVGLTPRVADAGAPPVAWLPIALSEVAVLADTAVSATEKEAFQATLARASDGRIDLEVAEALAPHLVESAGEAVRHHRFGDMYRPLFAVFLRAGASFAECADTLRELLSTFWSHQAAPVERWGALVDRLVERLVAVGRPLQGSRLAAAWLQAILESKRGGWNPQLARLVDSLQPDDARRCAALLIREMGQLPSVEPWTSLIDRLPTLLESSEDLQETYRRKILKRTVADGRLIQTAVTAGIETLLPDLASKERLSSADYDQIARLARDILPEGRARLGAILGLLTDSSKRPVEIEALERRLLVEAEKRLVARHLPTDLPPFTELERTASPALLITLARWLGDAWRHDPSGAARFVNGAVARDRMDVVGAFLRRAETPDESFLAMVQDEHLRRELQRAVRQPRHWLDLGPMEGRLATLAAPPPIESRARSDDRDDVHDA